MKIVKVIVVVFWAVMMTLLFHFEVFPGLFGHKQLSYLELIPQDLMLEDNWMGVYFQGVKIGYMHTYVSVPPGKQISQFLIRNNTFLQVPILGRSEQIYFNTEALIDAGHRLKNFWVDLNSARYSTKLTGQLLEEEDWLLVVESAGKKRSTRLSLPKDSVLYSPLAPLPTGKLSSGRKFTVKMFDPISMSAEEVFIEPLGKETLHVMKKDFRATKLKIDYKGIETFAWVNEEGELLKEETPLGWLILKEDAEEILDFMREKPTVMIDLIASTSVRSNVEIENARESRFLKADLKGYVLDKKNLESSRQNIIAADDDKITLSVDALGPPDKALSLPIEKDELREFLAPSIFIQSDDQEIIKTAKNIVGNTKDSWQAAVLLNRWVYKHVKKVPAMSIPSSLEVLHHMQGDCNEHAFLYTALARSLSIPTKIAYGLLYQQGGFYYHAWPQVYVGSWVDMDPTLGQDVACATHIKLLEGEIKDQLALVKVIGKLEIKIKEYR
ncbi:MAG: transglutaminase domain-containing protein [Candidatus Omnitrophica bacterium]|nr:transglutaminase domain-containing protein [Candidatus Omnitrophota bacterium]